MKKRGLILCIAVIAAMLTAGCAAEPAKIEPQGKAYFTYFDTVSYVYSYAGDSAERFDERSAEVSAILGEYHKLFDIYHEYSGMNNLCTLNRQAGGEALPVDEKLITFLDYAQKLYELTGGEMNVMMGSVLRLWHDSREAAAEDPAAAELPGEEALAEAAGHIDFSALEIDRERLTLRISDPEASIDVGALGKGYATERAAEFLEADGAEGYVLNVGGNIRIVGTKPDGSGWVTGIRNPAGDEKEFAISLRLKDTACVTSGVYERYFVVDGQRYHHIIDKDSLFPADYFASLTVLTQDSALADALSTALFCMSYEDGLAMVSGMDGVEILWIFPDGEIRYTDGVEKLIEK